MVPRRTQNKLQLDGFLPRAVLRGLLIVAAALLPLAALSIGLQQRLTDCESPLDAEEFYEEAVARFHQNLMASPRL